MRRMSGFSLMEMMIVLLIVAIVAAASAPMINKKMLTNASSESPWVWTGLSNNIAYNLGGKEQTAIIGTITPVTNAKSRLHIESKADSTSSYIMPHLSLKGTTNNPVNITTNHGAIFISNNRMSAATSSPPPAMSVAVGYSASVGGPSSVAIGSSTTSYQNAVAIGGGTSIKAETQGVAIGGGEVEAKSYGVAIGSKAGNRLTYAAKNSVAIGSGAFAATTNSVAIGDMAGNPTGVFGAIAIGKSSYLDGDRTIAIGEYAEAKGLAAIAIGSAGVSGETYDRDIIKHTIADGNASIAIGQGVLANGSSAMAIGHSASAKGNYSTAIGYAATSDKDNQVVIGRPADTVYIPGTLKVNSLDLSSITGTITIGADSATVKIPGNVDLCTNSSSTLRVGVAQINGNNWGLGKVTKEDVGTQGYRMLRVDKDSDRRLKDVGEVFKGGLEELKKLELFHFTYKKDKAKTPHVGVMAQDLQKVFPDAVFKGDDGFLRIRMEDMFYALINAVKELDTKITALKEQEIFSLKKQVTDLEKQNKELVKTIEKLEKRLDKLEKKKDK